jgi:hypothetical protein
MCAARGRVTCSETLHPTGCSRPGTTEVVFCRVRLDGQDAGLSIRQRGFESRTRCHDTTCLVNSAVRVPACRAGSRGFDSRTRRQNIAEIAQTAERRVESACVGGSMPSLGTSKPNLVSSVDPERRPTKPEAARSNRARGANTRRASSTGRAAASKAEGSRFDPVARCQFQFSIIQLFPR